MNVRELTEQITDLNAELYVQSLRNKYDTLVYLCTMIDEQNIIFDKGSQSLTFTDTLQDCQCTFYVADIEAFAFDGQKIFVWFSHDKEDNRHVVISSNSVEHVDRLRSINPMKGVD